MLTPALLEVMVAAARAGGQAALAIEGATAWAKADGSPVTAADHAAEEAILRTLAAGAPGVPVLSEEQAEAHGAPPLGRAFFAVDPIDGTKEFIAGNGEWAVCVGLVVEGEAVAGALYAPAKGRLFAGGAGLGAFEERSGGPRRPIAARPRPAAPVALVSRSRTEAATLDLLAAEGFGEERRVRCGSALKFALVAAGEADLYARLAPLSAWDAAAGDALVKAAGGRCVTPEGAPLAYGPPEYVVRALIARGR